MKLPNPLARIVRDRSGQAMIEFAFVVIILAVLMFGLIDFSRFITTRQTLINVTREGSNLALRQTDLPTAAAAVIASASPLTINTKGRVIITEVSSIAGVNRITGQFISGALGATSKIGTGTNNVATMPAGVTGIPQPNDKVYITEVFYTFTPITPIGHLLSITLPPTIYDVAYFM